MQNTLATLKMETEQRKIAIPGQIIVTGNQYLPSDGVYRDGEHIIAKQFGLANISDKYVKVISISGPYKPRRGNTIIGTVVDCVGSGWTIDIGLISNAYLPVTEVPRFIHRNEMKDFLDSGDTIIAKINEIGGRGIDLSIKQRGLGKVEEGIILSINPNKVPRIIGKEGSMVRLIRGATGVSLTVGQNGKIWINAPSIEGELKTKEIIDFVERNSTMQGLTQRTEEYIKEIGLQVPDLSTPQETDEEVEVIEESNQEEERDE